MRIFDFCCRRNRFQSKETSRAEMQPVTPRTPSYPTDFRPRALSDPYMQTLSFSNDVEAVYEPRPASLPRVRSKSLFLSLTPRRSPQTPRAPEAYMLFENSVSVEYDENSTDNIYINHEKLPPEFLPCTFDK